MQDNEQLERCVDAAIAKRDQVRVVANIDDLQNSMIISALVAHDGIRETMVQLTDEQKAPIVQLLVTAGLARKQELMAMPIAKFAAMSVREIQTEIVKAALAEWQ